ncbi:MAG: ATP/GTP-binding protein [Chloroflexota bacterium]|nr:ATP/GTP-binding protein [Chloroflexota bacterium]
MAEEPLLNILKIVITGAYAAGKTQFIKTISEIEVVDTEVEASNDEERLFKSHTTVALDFGIITVNEQLALYLFGTPGQERFDFMWEILSLGCIGYVVMVDSCRPAHFKEALGVIRYFTNLTDVPFVVAANKQDDPTALPLDYIRRRLGLAEEIPVLSCVATDRESVKEVLLTLLDRIYELSGTP